MAANDDSRLSAGEAGVSKPANDPSFDSLWDELVWRGLVHVSTDADELKALLAGKPIT